MGVQAMSHPAVEQLRFTRGEWPHYWFHIGEIQSIRQMLGHKRLPIYVGSFEANAPYRPETD